MIYKGFASVYDYLMKDTPYDNWYALLTKKMNEYKFQGKDILDLACGTGEMTLRLAKDGYKPLGLDLSEEMLGIAQNKAFENNLKAGFICQDMTTMELFHEYDAIISFCDGFNYIKDYEDLSITFDKINNYLKPGGLFIFDMSSDYKLKHVLADNVFTETSDSACYIWENYFDDETKLLEFDLTIFEKSGNLYQRFDEVHIQRAYSIKEITNLLDESNIELLEVIDTITGQELSRQSERWLFIGRKYE